MTLDVYLSIKAYQLYRKFQRNNGEGLQVQKEKNKTIQHLKPIITLLITILGSMAIACIAYVSTLMMENTSYQMFAKNVMIPNCFHVSAVLHSMVYGLYFSEICRSLCRRFKCIVRCCKFKKKMNSILPR